MDSTQLYRSVAALGDAPGAFVAGHFATSLRRVLSGPAVTREPRFIRMQTGASHPFGNLACLRDSADVAGTQAAIEPLVAGNAPAAVVFVGSVSAEVKRLVRSAGFGHCEKIPAMTVDIADGLAPTRLPPGFTFARVRTPDECRAWGRVCVTGNEMPSVLENSFLGGIEDCHRDDASLQYYWILKHGIPVCTSLLLQDQGVAGVYCVATIPAERMQGLAAHATAEPLRIAMRAGYRVGVLHATSAGYPVYRRLGFADCGEVLLFVRMPFTDNSMDCV